MSRKFLTPIDLANNEIQNVAAQNLATDPTGFPGRFYYNTVGDLRYYDGTAWKTVNTGQGSFTLGSTLISLGSTTYSLAGLTSVSSTSFVGALTGNASTATTLQNSRNINGQAFNGSADITITANTPYNFNLGTGLTASNGASPWNGSANITVAVDTTVIATRTYVDNAVAGLTWKASVNLLATSNIPLTGSTGTVVIDGHSALTQSKTGYRLVLTAQSVSADNGIYVYSDDGTSYTLTRATDADTYQELIGATVFIEEGTVYGNSAWTQGNHYITNFSGQNWVQFSGAATITAGNGLTKNGNTINVVGTTNRIIANADSIDIDINYVGQTSITTLGTITSGTWNGNAIPVLYGGTGATTVADAKTNLGFATKYTATNPSLSPTSSVVTWTITAATHGLGTSGIWITQLKDITTSTATFVVDVDIVVNEVTGDVTLSWNSSTTVTAGKYRVIMVG